jgi:hypothetical protein
VHASYRALVDVVKLEQQACGRDMAVKKDPIVPKANKRVSHSRPCQNNWFKLVH